MSQQTSIKKIVDLVLSSRRNCPAHFYAEGIRMQTFGIDFEPLSEKDDAALASMSFYSLVINDSDKDIQLEKYYQIMKIGEDLMLAAFIAAKLDELTILPDIKDALIAKNVKIFHQSEEPTIDEVINTQTTKDYLDYCLYVGEKQAKQESIDYFENWLLHKKKKQKEIKR